MMEHVELMLEARRRQDVPKKATSDDIIIRWKEIEKEFSFTGFLSIEAGAVQGLRHKSFWFFKHSYGNFRWENPSWCNYRRLLNQI